MHRNFFLFEKQAASLAEKMNGATIVRSFTFRKNELTLHLNNPDVFLQISIDLNYPALLSAPVTTVRRPQFQLFQSLSGQTIRALKIIPYDKHVQLLTDDFILEMVFYGRQPNIFLYDKNALLLESFKDKAREEFLSQKKQLDFRYLNKTALAEAAANAPAEKPDIFLRRHLYAFNKTLLNETLHRLDVPAGRPLSDLPNGILRRLQEILTEITREIAEDKQYLYFESRQCSALSLFPLRHKTENPDVTVETYADLNRVWWKFISLKRDSENLQRLRSKCETGIKKRLEYIERSLAKLQQAEDVKARKEEAERKGNLLLTFQAEIAAGASEVVLEDIFGGSGKRIRIKLNPSKNVVQNAGRYFNKYKNITEKKEILQIKKDTLLAEKKQISNLQKKLSGGKYTQVQKVHDALIAMKVLQTKKSAAETGKGLQYAFKRRILDNEWDVFIGKSGVNNDLLTFAFAGKHDLWLHAQGVPGSHVVIRLPQKKIHPPQKVIEQAAQIAAANSKARFSATVPVIITEVRYVSRIRKAQPGTVSVRNEKVLFVKPLHF